MSDGLTAIFIGTSIVGPCEIPVRRHEKHSARKGFASGSEVVANDARFSFGAVTLRGTVTTTLSTDSRPLIQQHAHQPMTVVSTHRSTYDERTASLKL